ncbi:alkaline phosphatase family protein [Bacillus cereus]|uniref:alkaline phosphatase family protein n=1 Tax=Bacillus cereus TaxID=1396 RepID=UPI00065BD48D|nr:alkaline phosphatase family protein [Bacillus cereus]KMQ32173.1 hypothetical protein TU58_01415 [Bacillus cereus]
MRTVIIGLDCGDPTLLFSKFRGKLKTFSMLMENGSYGKLRSVDPPITVPAWMSMMTGKTPGALGIYGFRNRIDYSYDSLGIADSSWVKYPTLWDKVGAIGGQSIVMGVPLTYPPKPIDGHLVSCFMTPSKKSNYTYPPELKKELEKVSPGYEFDVKSFRTDNKDIILEEIYRMSRERLKVATYLMNNKMWDLFVMVEIGLDRLMHAFWEYMDEEHVLYKPNSPYATAIEEYFIWLDQELEIFLSQIPDDTMLYVVSDHGALRMDGGFRINQWLLENGYLHLKSQPEPNKSLNYENIDWEKTMAWGEGGYYGRLFINLKDREENGIVEPTEYQSLLERLEREMTHTPGPERWQGVRFLDPKAIYPEVRGVAPDALVYCGELSWRCLGTLGQSVFSLENDHGPDGANHGLDGIFLTAVKRKEKWKRNPDFSKGELARLSILDIHSIVLDSICSIKSEL